MRGYGGVSSSSKYVDLDFRTFVLAVQLPTAEILLKIRWIFRFNKKFQDLYKKLFLPINNKKSTLCNI